MVDAIYAKIPRSTTDTADNNAYGGKVYSYPCDSKPEVAFSFSGIDRKLFTINPLDFNLGPTG
jgi:hypothetical protein